MKKLGAFLLVHSVLYLIGCFIAWDINPLHWWIFTSSFGRILFLLFEMTCIVNYLSED